MFVNVVGVYFLVTNVIIIVYGKNIATNWINLSADGRIFLYSFEDAIINIMFARLIIGMNECGYNVIDRFKLSHYHLRWSNKIHRTMNFLNNFIIAEINGLPYSEIDLNDPSRSNYTVTFVPLISIIADYLPIFLKRLRTQEVTTARSLKWLLSDEKICTPHHLGRFPNPDNQCQFFECAMNFKNLYNCSQANRTDQRDGKVAKHIDDVIQLKSEKISKHNHQASLAVMYRVNECVSLILHQCSSQHIYSNRLQRCVPHKRAKCTE